MTAALFKLHSYELIKTDTEKHMLKCRLKTSLVTLLSLVLMIPSMFCVFIPGGSAHAMAISATSGIETTTKNQIANHQMMSNHHNHQAMMKKMAKSASVSNKLSTPQMLECLFDCLDKYEQPSYLADSNSVFKALTPPQSDELQITLPIHLLISLSPNDPTILTTGPPPDQFSHFEKTTPLTKTHRLRL